MQKTLTCCLLLTLLSFFTFIGQSCKKRDALRDQLIGTWFDPAGNYIVFNGDGSGSVRILGYAADPMVWQLQDGDRQIWVTYVGGSSEIWHVVTVSSTEFDFIQGNGSGTIVCHK
jgi:hypothetical protein